MISYVECHKECACFYFNKDKNECIFKKLCIALELPMEKKANNNG